MGDKTFVCLCLDITEQDVAVAVAKGFTDPEVFKRFTACFMGPCQGKACMETVLTSLAEKTGADPATMRRPTWRPPAYPVRLGTLAGLGELDEG